jgi:anti-sigma-K factor RskA
MPNVITIVSATIAPDRAAELTAAFGAAVRGGLPERRQTTLMKGDGNRWQIVTLWRSRADLDAYVAAVAEPFAVGLFRRMGGVPEVAVYEVVVDSNAPWWP